MNRRGVRTPLPEIATVRSATDGHYTCDDVAMIAGETVCHPSSIRHARHVNSRRVYIEALDDGFDGISQEAAVTVVRVVADIIAAEWYKRGAAYATAALLRRTPGRYGREAAERRC